MKRVSERFWPLLSVASLATVVALVLPAPSHGDTPKPIRLAGKKIELTPPAEWTQKEPKFKGIVDYEFSVAPADGDKVAGRVIVGGAGGGIDANKRRWLRQYTQPDGKSTADRAKIEKKKIAGCTVHLIDVSGTFNAPPFDPAGGGPRKNYRLLAAIVEAGKLGSYYVKFYGPARTVAKNEQAFQKMIKDLKRTE